jgi:hypothetical protein
MQYVQGTFILSKTPGPFRNDKGRIPKVERNLLMIPPILWDLRRFKERALELKFTLAIGESLLHSS